MAFEVGGVSFMWADGEEIRRDRKGQGRGWWKEV